MPVSGKVAEITLFLFLFQSNYVPFRFYYLLGVGFQKNIAELTNDYWCIDNLNLMQTLLKTNRNTSLDLFWKIFYIRTDFSLSLSLETLAQFWKNFRIHLFIGALRVCIIIFSIRIFVCSQTIDHCRVYWLTLIRSDSHLALTNFQCQFFSLWSVIFKFF